MHSTRIVVTGLLSVVAASTALAQPAGFDPSGAFGRFEFTTVNPNNFTQGNAFTSGSPITVNVNGSGGTSGGLGGVSASGSYDDVNNTFNIGASVFTNFFPGASGTIWGQVSIPFTVEGSLIVDITDNSFGSNSSGQILARVQLFSATDPFTPIPDGSTIGSGVYRWDAFSASSSSREYARLSLTPVPAPGVSAIATCGLVAALRRRRR
jgi:hypothetical protein